MLMPPGDKINYYHHHAGSSDTDSCLHFVTGRVILKSIFQFTPFLALHPATITMGISIILGPYLPEKPHVRVNISYLLYLEIYIGTN